MASDFLADEMLHVELTARLAAELGGAANYQIDFAKLKLPLDPDLHPMQRSNELIVRICCVHCFQTNSPRFRSKCTGFSCDT